MKKKILVNINEQNLEIIRQLLQKKWGWKPSNSEIVDVGIEVILVMCGLGLEECRIEQAQLPRAPMNKVRPLVNRGTELFGSLRGTKIALECLDKFRRLTVKVKIPHEIKNFQQTVPVVPSLAEPGPIGKFFGSPLDKVSVLVKSFEFILPMPDGIVTDGRGHVEFVLHGIPHIDSEVLEPGLLVILGLVLGVLVLDRLLQGKDGLTLVLVQEERSNRLLLREHLSAGGFGLVFHNIPPMVRNVVKYCTFAQPTKQELLIPKAVRMEYPTQR